MVMDSVMFFLSKNPIVIFLYVGILTVIRFWNFPRELAEIVSGLAKIRHKNNPQH
jgi:hypothetical protein